MSQLNVLIDLRNKIDHLEAGWSRCSQACARLQDERDAARKESATLRGALSLLAAILEAPQNRFGKLEFYTDEARVAREALRQMGQELGVTPSHSIPEQAAKVARAVIEKATKERQ